MHLPDVNPNILGTITVFNNCDNIFEKATLANKEWVTEVESCLGIILSPEDLFVIQQAAYHRGSVLEMMEYLQGVHTKLVFTK